MYCKIYSSNIEEKHHPLFICLYIAMISRIIISSRSIKTWHLAVVVTIGLLALVASRIASTIHPPATVQIDPQIDANANSGHKYNSNTGYFTSMEAEFEWNQFMVPGYYPDFDAPIARDRETERKLLEEGHFQHKTLRALRNGY
jgi:hypothetical protein